MQRTESIRFRVSPEEKAEVERLAGDEGMSAYVRGRVLGTNAVPVASSGKVDVLDAAPAGEQGRAALPAQTWPARVRQLVMQGVPQRAAEQIADQELRSK